MPILKPRLVPPPVLFFDDPDTEVAEVTDPGIGIRLRLPAVCPSRDLRHAVTVSRIRAYRAHLAHCDACVSERAKYLNSVREQLETGAHVSQWRSVPMTSWLSNIDDDITHLFETAGYTVTWDARRDQSLVWYEVMDGSQMLLQIDYGKVRAHDLMRDIPLFLAGQPGHPDGPDYQIRYDDPKVLADVWARLQRVGSDA